MVEGLTYIEDSLSIELPVCSSSLFSSLRRIPAVRNIHRGVEQWQLVGLITRRSGVRIPSPLPNLFRGPPIGGPFRVPGPDDGRRADAQPGRP